MTHYDPHDWDPEYKDDVPTTGRALLWGLVLLAVSTFAAVIVVAIL